jgi:hypothetical protein
MYTVKNESLDAVSSAMFITSFDKLGSRQNHFRRTVAQARDEFIKESLVR